jgi:hypothetical protein
MIARLLPLVLLAGSASAQNVVHYATTTDNVKYLFATAEPVARVHSGDILDTNTLDCFGNVLKRPGDKLSMVKGDNPLAGPFYVEGADQGRVNVAAPLQGHSSTRPAFHTFLSRTGNRRA